MVPFQLEHILHRFTSCMDRELGFDIVEACAYHPSNLSLAFGRKNICDRSWLTAYELGASQCFQPPHYGWWCR